VEWNNSPLVTTFVSGTRLKAAVLASDLAEEGSASVTALNSGTTSNAVPFSVTDAPLTEASKTISPVEGLAFINLPVASFTDANPNATVRVTLNGVSLGDFAPIRRNAAPQSLLPIADLGGATLGVMQETPATGVQPQAAGQAAPPLDSALWSEPQWLLLDEALWAALGYHRRNHTLDPLF
jgi:hypothetical protein